MFVVFLRDAAFLAGAAGLFARFAAGSAVTLRFVTVLAAPLADPSVFLFSLPYDVVSRRTRGTGSPGSLLMAFFRDLGNAKF